MHVAKKRRRFRFRLRTLLLTIALMGGGLAWIASNLNWIRERRSFLADYQKKPPAPSQFGTHGSSWDLRRRSSRQQNARFKFSGTISPQAAGHTYRGFVLWMFGEGEHTELHLIFPTNRLGNDTIERTGELFPEATVTWSTGANRGPR